MPEHVLHDDGDIVTTSATARRRRLPLAVPARDAVVVDCGTCSVRGDACRGCVVSVVLGPPPELVDADEVAALAALARSGLVPPLRLLPDEPAG